MSEKLSTAGLIGTLLSGIFFENFEEENKNAKEYILSLVKKIEYYAGEENSFELFIKFRFPVLIAIMASIDLAVVEKVTDETLGKLRNLCGPDRILSETLYLMLTGQYTLKPGGEKNRWWQPLWGLKKTVADFVKVSPTQIEAADILPPLKETLVIFAESIVAEVGKSFKKTGA